jgi:hypothetical protein
VRGTVVRLGVRGVAGRGVGLASGAGAAGAEAGGAGTAGAAGATGVTGATGRGCACPGAAIAARRKPAKLTVLSWRSVRLKAEDRTGLGCSRVIGIGGVLQD